MSALNDDAAGAARAMARVVAPAAPIFGHRWGLPSLGLRASERRVLLMSMDVLLVNAALFVAVLCDTDLLSSWEALLAFAKWFVALSLVWLAAAQFFDCYNLARAASSTASLRNSAAAVVATVAIYTLIPYFTPPLTSRGLIFFTLAFMLGAVLPWRLGYARLFVQPWFQQQALVVGAGAAGVALVSALRSAPHDANPFRGTGYQIAGFIDDDPACQGCTVEGIPVLGDQSSLVEMAQAYGAREIILAITHRHAMSPGLLDALLRCRELGLRVVTMATVYERLTGRVPVDHVGEDLQMVVPMDDRVGERVYDLLKRGIDLASALAGLVVIGLVIPPIALSNALSSPGPLFYRQKRVGRGGRVFEVIKFRSMRPDAERATGAVWASTGDDRITPVGRWLRKTRIDELPQLVNILRGEMSLIGPRPERPEFVDRLAQTIPFYRARHAVRPGITGWAQICYRYGSSHEDARVKLEYDLYYVRHVSPFLDLSIALQTLPVMLQGKGT
jgi:exopolysaccharide biosynthesis polyprenyl glycosylphosphotransferase